jgi:thiol:disulfide interchange protein DsbA
MNKCVALLLSICLGLTLAGCGQKETPPPAQTSLPTENVEAPAVKTESESDPSAESSAQEAAAQAPAETISETDDEPQEAAAANPSTQPSLKVGGAPSGPPTSARFREGTHYRKIVPAQPTNAAPGKVEVAEAFWYGCGHCFSLDPALESWRAKAPSYIEFARIPAMWNETTRIHARLFYTAELLGKLDSLHTLIFREIHVNGNALNTADKIAAFFAQHGVSRSDFDSTFSSFAVEAKLQRADLLNRRYRVQSVPTLLINGKYSTDVSSAGSEANLFTLIGELAAYEHGG